MMPTAWIPFLDTNEDNGGMQIIPFTHKEGKIGTNNTKILWGVMEIQLEVKKSRANIFTFVLIFNRQYFKIQ